MRRKAISSTAGQPLLRIFDPSDMEVQAKVGEPDGAALVPGARAQVSLDAYPDLVFTGALQVGQPGCHCSARQPDQDFHRHFPVGKTGSSFPPRSFSRSGHSCPRTVNNERRRSIPGPSRDRKGASRKHRAKGWISFGVIFLVAGRGERRHLPLKHVEASTTLPMAPARKGDFSVIVRCRGELKARVSKQLNAPVNVPDLRIVWAAPPSSQVKAGDVGDSLRSQQRPAAASGKGSRAAASPGHARSGSGAGPHHRRAGPAAISPPRATPWRKRAWKPPSRKSSAPCKARKTRSTSRSPKRTEGEGGRRATCMPHPTPPRPLLSRACATRPRPTWISPNSRLGQMQLVAPLERLDHLSAELLARLDERQAVSRWAIRCGPARRSPKFPDLNYARDGRQDRRDRSRPNCPRRSLRASASIRSRS